MKTITLIISAVLCISSSAFTQPISSLIEQLPNTKSVLPRPVETMGNNGSTLSGYRTSIYSESFDGGLPADWTTETVSGPCNWEWTNSGHQGDYPSYPLASTSASNGWMILDSDFCNSPGGGMELNHLTSPSINCSDYDFVSIRFEQYYRSFQFDITTIEVSNNGGLNWIPFLINEYVTQAGTSNPNLVQINISTLAANQPDVQVRFTWEANGAYGWQIDDFALVVPIDNDLGIMNSGIQNPWDAFTEDNARNIEYSIYPVTQVREFNFRAKAENYGAFMQTGVVLQVNINDGAGYNQTVMSAPASILPGEFHDFNISYMPPSVIGDYSITYTIIQNEVDGYEENNVEFGFFKISEGEYARDRFQSTGQFTIPTSDYKLGNRFYMEIDEDIHCIGAALGNSSVPGTFFTYEVIEADYFEFIAESTLASVPPSNELNAIGGDVFQWTYMEGPVLVHAGVDYVVALNLFGGGSADVILSLSGESPALSSFYYDGSQSTWYYTNQTPMLRIGLSEEFCASVIPQLIYGCTDPYANNFNYYATIDDGSCQYNDPGDCDVSYFLIPPLPIWNNTVIIYLDYNSFGYNSFHWDFGDGQTSQEMYPSHYYAEDGDYLLCVTLNVTDELDEIICTDTFCQTINSDWINGLAGHGFSATRQNGFYLMVSGSPTVGQVELEPNSSYTIFPNPASDLLYVNYPENTPEAKLIEFHDISGKLIMAETIPPVLNQGHQLVFDISNLPAGIYFVSIESSTGRETHKLLKQ